MKKKDKLLILLVIVAITGCFGVFLITNFQQGKYNIRLKMTQAIQETITKDYYKRLFQDNVHTPKSLGRKIKGIKIAIGGNTENILFKDSIDEQIAYQLVDQYVLAQFTPITPNDFNAIFKEELKEKGITDKTGIVYRHNGIPQYSDNDSLSPQSALRTDIKMLDIKNTISVQGWVDYSWRTLLKHTDTKNLWIILVCYIASLAVALFKKKRTKNIEKPAIEEDNLNLCEVERIKEDNLNLCEAERIKEDNLNLCEAERIKEDNLNLCEAERIEEDNLNLCEAERIEEDNSNLCEAERIEEDNSNLCEARRIKLDLEKRLLYIDNMECSITKMDFDLLRMFWEAPNHYLSREDIRQAFWPKEDSADDKINSHITSLRNKIKNLQGYTIKRIRGKGYCLDIP